MPDALARFRLATEGSFSLDRAALLLGDWVAPVNIDAGLAALDDWATRVGRPDLERLRAVLFGPDGFSGAPNYENPRHSFLSFVLAERTGIPISLSVVCLEVARRVGLPAFGIAFPGHFLVGVGDPSAPTIIDPYHAATILTRDDLATLLARIDPARPWDDELLAPATSRQILQRMLQNLAGIYGRSDDLGRSLDVLERLHVLLPDHPRIAGQLAALRARADAIN